jgi:urease accessory protein
MVPLSANRLKQSVPLIAGIALTIVGLSSPAMAHVTNASGAGFGGGFAHPFSGLDHILAMVAVGMWASQLGRPAYWLLPLTFPVAMALGAILGVIGVQLPWVEIGIAASVVVLGMLIAAALQPSLALSIVLIGLFALVHGHSHGTELPQAASSLAYGAGFLGATVALHTIGLTIGSTSRWPLARFGFRAAGAAIAVVGLLLLVSA